MPALLDAEAHMAWRTLLKYSSLRLHQAGSRRQMPVLLLAEAHTDWLEDWWHPQLGNERIATVIMYLNDVAEGGETVFPNSTSQPVRPVHTPMQSPILVICLNLCFVASILDGIVSSCLQTRQMCKMPGPFDEHAEAVHTPMQIACTISVNMSPARPHALLSAYPCRWPAPFQLPRVQTAKSPSIFVLGPFSWKRER